MLVCSHVVENSTEEKRYFPAAGKEARIVWLQRSKTVDDQFKSFAIFPKEAQAAVTTSQRRKPLSESSSGGSKRRSDGLQRLFDLLTSEAVKTIIGTIVGICGFVVQFIGLHGMHWSASIAQLGAIVVMTVLRALVHRNLAERPIVWLLYPEHEMDWLAMTLGDRDKAPWQNPPEFYEDNSSKPLADDGGWDWRTVAVEDPSINGSIKPLQADDGGVERSRSKAHRVMIMRRELGELARWRGPASAEAIAVARAIGVTMNILDTLFPKSLGRELTWSLAASLAASHEIFVRESIAFSVKKHEDKWKADPGEIEAALSLWLYSVYKQEQGGREDNMWLEAEGAPAKRSLRLLGSSTPSLRRDLQWWVPNGAIRLIKVKTHDPKTHDDKIDVDTHRVVGYMSGSKLDTPQFALMPPGEDASNNVLAVESFSPLKTLFAQHMFSTFMWAAAKTMKGPIAREAKIQSTDGTSGDLAWQSFTLHNTQLSEMAQDIQSTGLGSLSEIYLSIIPPLSGEKKLPRADAIIKLARDHAKPHEQLGRWQKASEAYRWLFRTANASSKQNGIGVKATALLMEFLRAVTDAIELRNGQQFEEKGIQELERLKLELLDELRSAGVDALTGIMGLYDLQGRSWGCEFVRNAELSKDRYTDLKLTILHRLAHGERAIEGYTIENWMKEKKGGVSEKDILDWTPLHYAAATPSADALQELLKHLPDINTRDIRGRTPLHYACQHAGASTVRILIRERADIATQDIDGRVPIHLAAMYGKGEVVASLIEAGADVDVVDGFGSSPLLLAAYKGRIDVVEALLKVANTKLRDHNGRTALHLAVIAGVDDGTERELHRQWIRPVDKDVIKLLLDKDVGIEVKDRFGRTPLSWAAGMGREAVVQRLLENGAKIEAKDNFYGRTPLLWAADNGHVAVVQRLLKNSAYIEAEDTEYGRTPLSWAAGKGHAAVVQRLLENRADIEAKDNFYGRTPLSWAAGNGHADVVQRLLENHAQIEANRFGRTPLSWAAANGHAVVVQRLLENGAEIEAKDDFGRTPLSWAANPAVVQPLLENRAGKGHAAVVQRLLENGADIEAKDNADLTPLSYAAENGNEAVVQRLLENDAIIEAKDTNSRTPIWYAVKYNCETVVQRLLEKGANIGLKDVYCRTPLSYAAENGHIAIVQWLLEKGAEINLKDFYCRTPLSYAAENGHLAIVQRLLEKGAATEVKDNNGRTPLDYAITNEHKTIVKLLQSIKIVIT